MTRQTALFHVQDLPVLQNRMFPDRASALACAKGDVNLVQDMDTGLIHNAAFDASLLQYDAEYQNEQAVSGVFQHHLDAITAIIGRHLARRTLIEVGCGKAYFLEHLQRLGYAITGIDPAYEGDNPKVVKAPFAPGLGLSADGIVLRHVLEHMSDPVAFLNAITRANRGKGLIYIEVPCFDWICRHHAWFDIFYEHVNYFRLADFHRMFGTVQESGHVFGGQYLYVVADLATLRQPMLALDQGFEFPAGFLGDIGNKVAAARKRRCTVWGGASKGVIFALYMQRAGVDIGQVIDINPAKQGKFMAASGLKICSPDEGMASMAPGDNVFVMNSNYLAEIVRMTRNQYNYIPVDHHEF